MRDKTSSFISQISPRGVAVVRPKLASGLRDSDMLIHANAIEVKAAIASSPAPLPISTMTTEELLSRAKRSIDSCETPLREAAEDIARAYGQGATQREVALAVGKSPAWVNRLLKWRLSGYEGSAFGNKFVQGVNRSQPAPAVTGTVLTTISWADGVPVDAALKTDFELVIADTGLSKHV